jgi:IclR family mhp operon transcriptional activator
VTPTTPTRRDATRSGERLQSLERGLEVLAYLNRVGGCRSGDVARALKLKRSTVHRILAVLAELGLLQRDPSSHQYFLCAGVRELSSGFHDDPWITSVAEPLMRDWTRANRWPLLLVTPLAGVLTVRVSTDHESPISVERFVPGEVVPLEASSEGALVRAFSEAVDTGADAELRAIRRAGYCARPTACYTGARINVPVNAGDQLIGCIAMRCLPDTVGDPEELSRWVASLRELAGHIASQSAPLLGVAA